jgi:O-antigen/teichoic acid export membrane protein
MPEEYGASAVPLAVLCFGIVLQSTQQVTAVGISIEKKTFLFARVAWISAIVNLILNYFLIPIYGGQGAAWATTISYLVLTGCYLFYTQRLHPLPIQWNKICFMLVLGGCVMFLAVTENTLDISWKVIVFKLLLAIACVGLVWRVLPIRSFSYGN